MCVCVCAQAHECVEDSNSFVHLVNSVVYLPHDPFVSSSKKKALAKAICAQLPTFYVLLCDYYACGHSDVDAD